MNQAVESSNLDAAATAEGLADAAARWLRPADLRPWSGNPRRNEPAVPRVLASLERFGFVAPIVVWQSAGRMVAGHTRLRAAEELLRRDPSWRAKGAPAPGLVRVVFHEFASEAEADAYAIADNKLAEIAEWDDVALAEHVKRIEQEDASLLQAAGFVDEEVARLLEAADADAQIEQQEQRAQLERSEQEAAQQEKQQAAVRTLAERFGVPPFSVLDARQGYWQERKRAWLSLGIKSEVGRGTNLLGHNVELEIPGYYEKLNAGQSREAIIAEWQQANGGAVVYMRELLVDEPRGTRFSPRVAETLCRACGEREMLHQQLKVRMFLHAQQQDRLAMTPADGAADHVAPAATERA